MHMGDALYKLDVAADCDWLRWPRQATSSDSAWPARCKRQASHSAARVYSSPCTPHACAGFNVPGRCRTHPRPTRHLLPAPTGAVVATSGWSCGALRCAARSMSRVCVRASHKPKLFFCCDSDTHMRTRPMQWPPDLAPAARSDTRTVVVRNVLRGGTEPAHSHTGATTVSPTLTRQAAERRRISHRHICKTCRSSGPSEGKPSPLGGFMASDGPSFDIGGGGTGAAPRGPAIEFTNSVPNGLLH